MYPFDYSYRLHPLLSKLSYNFPYYTASPLYWCFHPALLLLCAAGIVFGFGTISRLSCAAFAVLQWMNLLRDISQHNNHEYLYVLIALALCLTSSHNSETSPLIRYALTPSHRSSVAIALYVVCVGYMMLQNAVYGIAGHIAVVGMLGVWGGTALTLLDGIESADVTNYDLYIMQILFSVVYVYAGVAKLDFDWLTGTTMRELLVQWTGPTAPSILVSFLLETKGYLFMAWSGAALDLIAGIALLIPYFPLRLLVAIALLAFHVTNHFLFVIETFPWVMISSLVLYFDASWIRGFGEWVEKYMFVRNIYFIFCSITDVCFRFIMPLFGVCLLITHVVLPLPCALHGYHNMVWQSNCQHFSWRMMTRSVKGFSAMLYFTHPVTKQFDALSFDKFGFTKEQEVEISSFEDMLFDLACKAKKQALSQSGDEAPPLVSADIWLQINGPPIQRYMDPLADVTAASPIAVDYFTTPSAIFRRPTPILHFVKQRLTQYRTTQWMHRMRTLEKQNDRSGYDTFFFADDTTSVPLAVEFSSSALLHVLDGQLAIRNSNILKTGMCVNVQGVVAMHPVEKNVTKSALWMISAPHNSISVRPWNFEDDVTPFVKLSVKCVHRIHRPRQAHDRHSEKRQSGEF